MSVVYHWLPVRISGGVEGGEQFSFGSEALTSVAPRPFGPRLPQVSCEIHIVPLPVGESQAEASAKKSARRGPGGGVVGCTKLIVDDSIVRAPLSRRTLLLLL